MTEQITVKNNNGSKPPIYIYDIPHIGLLTTVEIHGYNSDIKLDLVKADGILINNCLPINPTPDLAIYNMDVEMNLCVFTRLQLVIYSPINIPDVKLNYIWNNPPANKFPVTKGKFIYESGTLVQAIPDS